MRIVRLLAVILFLTPQPGMAQQDEGKPTFSVVTETFEPMANPDFTGFEELLAKEVYHRIGIAIALAHVPSARVLRNANEGIDDGILSRVGGMDALFPNLVQFREKVMDRQYVAFTRRDDITVAGWHSLKAYHVAFINGWKIFGRNVTDAKSITRVRTPEQLFLLLRHDRADVVLISRWAGLHQVKDLGLTNVRVLEPPLATKEVFFYTNKKHAAVIPRASAALKAMKEDGTYQRIFEETLGRLAPNRGQ